MKVFAKKLSAGLLTLAVVGGIWGYLTSSLASTRPISRDSTQATLAMEASELQTDTAVNETVIVYGTRPANYASIVAHRKQARAGGARYAAAPHERLGTVTLQ